MKQIVMLTLLIYIEPRVQPHLVRERGNLVSPYLIGANRYIGVCCCQEVMEEAHVYAPKCRRIFRLHHGKAGSCANGGILADVASLDAMAALRVRFLAFDLPPFAGIAALAALGVPFGRDGPPSDDLLLLRTLDSGVGRGCG